MKKVIYFLICICIIGCTNPNKDPLKNFIGSYKNYYNTTGKIKQDRYYSPNNVFSVEVPYLVKPGAIITDTFNKKFGLGNIDNDVGTVSFLDDFGRLIRIDVLRIPTELNSKEDITEEKLFNGIREYTLSIYKQGVPNSKLIYQKYSDYKGKKIDYFIVDMKNGSSLTNYDGKRNDALRASVSIIYNSYMYIFSKQYTYLPFGDTVKDKEEMKNDLLKIIDTLKM